MTAEQSKNLKLGARVCFNGDRSDRGTITETNVRHVKIKWDDKHTSFTGHDDMKRVEVLEPRR
jgi:hypothetical protein